MRNRALSVLRARQLIITMPRKQLIILTWQPTWWGNPPGSGGPNFQTRKVAYLRNGTFLHLDRLCSRASLLPGLGDQGSDTQDSTWILVQHCVISTTRKEHKFLAGPRTSPACHAGSSLGIIPVSTGPLPFVQCFHI